MSRLKAVVENNYLRLGSSKKEITVGLLLLDNAQFFSVVNNFNL